MCGVWQVKTKPNMLVLNKRRMSVLSNGYVYVFCFKYISEFIKTYLKLSKLPILTMGYNMCWVFKPILMKNLNRGLRALWSSQTAFTGRFKEVGIR